MRGKLRDKRATTRRDVTKRELIERRRPNKRDIRTDTRLYLQADENEFEDYIDDDEEMELEPPQTK